MSIRLRIVAASIFLSVLLVSCRGGGDSGSNTAPTPPATPPSSGSSAQFSRVFLVVLENMTYTEVAGSVDMPYLSGLAARYSVAANYDANTHPSIGNYFMMTTGQIVTNDDTFTGTVSADNMVRELTAAGKSWKVYAENLPSAGYTGGDVLPYVRRHNPFAYFTDVAGTPAAANIVPFPNLSADLTAGTLPNFVYIAPNVYDDMHDCPPSIPSCTLSDRRKFCDAWLKATLDPILNSSAFSSGALLIVTFDESTDTDTVNGGGHVFTMLASPHAKPGFSSATLYQHQSLLRLMLEGLGVQALPGAAASAPKMSEFFQ